LGGGGGGGDLGGGDDEDDGDVFGDLLETSLDVEFLGLFSN
jgi:hypothetical protein